MRNQALTVGSALFLALTAGCSGEDPDGSGSGGTSPASGGETGVGGGAAMGGGDGVGGGTATGGGTNDPDVVPTCEARTTDATTGNQVVIADAAHNYTFWSSLNLNPIPVAPSSNLHFDWSGMTQDFLGQPVDAINDIDMVMLVVWDLSLADLQAKLNDDALTQRDYNVMCNVYPIDSRPMTSVDLFDFGMLRAPVDPDPAEAERILRDYLNPEIYDQSVTSYTLMTQKGADTPGVGTQMIQAITLDPASTNTTVNITDTSTTLEYDADLHSLQKTYVAPGAANLTINWEGLTVNAMGRTADPVEISNVMVSKYTQTPAELEGDLFLDLEYIATDSWTADLASIGTSFDLSMLETTAGSGSFFPGIDDTGTWILALRCGDCRNPAPWFMTVLAPCTP